MGSKMKRFTIVAGCLFLAASSLAIYSSIADDEVSKPIPHDEPNAQLIERIEKLEKRIEELEATVKQAPSKVRPGPDVYYTGGRLPGGEWLMPLSTKLDVLSAIRAAGGLGPNPAGTIYIMRRIKDMEGNSSLQTIELEVETMINTPNKRPTIQSGDTIMMR